MITVKKSQTITFINLKPGQFFRDANGDYVWVKLKDLGDNAYCINLHNTISFAPNDRVVPLKLEDATFSDS